MKFRYHWIHNGSLADCMDMPMIVVLISERKMWVKFALKNGVAT